MRDLIKLALLVSGGGTTMRRILDACYDGVLQGLIEPVLVIASNGSIGGIQRAIDAGFPADSIHVCCRKQYNSPSEFGDGLLGLLNRYKVGLIGQYGWLPKTPVNVINEYPQRIINQHPGPLDTGRPDFGGKGMHGRRVHCARLLFARETGLEFDQFTEATTHYVTGEFDRGYVIGSRRVEILPNDDVISLQDKVLIEEYGLQIDVLGQFGEGTVKMQFRDSPLVQSDQYGLLAESKRIAGLLFPNG